MLKTQNQNQVKAEVEVKVKRKNKLQERKIKILKKLMYLLYQMSLTLKQQVLLRKEFLHLKLI